MDENNNDLPPPKKSNLKQGNNESKITISSPINIPPLRDVAKEEETKRNLFKNKLSGLIIGVTISFALMGVSFWWGLEIGRNSISKNNIQIPIITADKKPIKVIPENPGGMDIPHKDILVLDNSRNAEIIQNDKIVVIPEPEKPILSINNNFEKNTKEELPEKIENNLFEKKITKLNTIEEKDKEKNIEILDSPQIQAEISKNSEKNLSLNLDNSQNLNNELTQLNNTTNQTNKNLNNEKKFKVQIASYRKKASAIIGWNKISKKYISEFKNLEPIFERVEIPNKGVFFRLQTGKFNNKENAKEFCNKLKKLNLNCLVVIK